MVVRLGLGAIFLWAGVGKFFAERGYSPEECAVLANMGVDIPTARVTPASTPANPATNPANLTPTMAPPAAPIPEAPGGKNNKNKQSKPNRGEPPVPVNVPSREIAFHQVRDEDVLVSLPAAASTKAENAKRRPPATPGAPSGSVPGSPASPGAPNAAAPNASPSAPAIKIISAADFPRGATMRQLYEVALVVKNAAKDKPGSIGPSSIWPAWAASGSWPVAIAWLVGLTEMIGGACILLGLFTRLSAFMLLGLMLGAMWLTELGPAMQAGKTMLLILPDRGPGTLFNEQLWQHWMWQLAMMTLALGAMLMGPGPLSLDHGVFAPGSEEPAESKPKPPKPQ